MTTGYDMTMLLTRARIATLCALLCWMCNTIGWCGQPWYVRLMPELTPIYQLRHGPHTSFTKLKGLMPPETTSVWLMDLDSIRRGIYQSSPWVKTVHLRRRFPNLLVVAVIEHKFLGRSGDALIADDGTRVHVAPNFCTNDVPELDYSGEHTDLVLLCQLLGEAGLFPERIARDKYGDWSIQLDGHLVYLGSKNLALEITTFVKWCTIHDVILTPWVGKKRKITTILEIVNPPRVWVLGANYRKNLSFV